MAGFEVTFNGRFWVTPEDSIVEFWTGNRRQPIDWSGAAFDSVGREILFLVRKPERIRFWGLVRVPFFA